MGGPQYETPYPVDAGDGTQVIWNWGTKSWGPYDAKAAQAKAADIAATPTDKTERDSQTDRSAAPDPTGIGAPGGKGEGIAITERPRGALPAPRLLRARQQAAGRGMPGASLLYDTTPRERG